MSQKFKYVNESIFKKIMKVELSVRCYSYSEITIFYYLLRSKNNSITWNSQDRLENVEVKDRLPCIFYVGRGGQSLYFNSDCYDHNLVNFIDIII